MSFAIDLSEHGHELKKQYESVISSDPSTTWTVFGYDSASPSSLKPVESGNGDLDEFVAAFDDASIEYGLAQVEFGGVLKIVLVGYLGENVSARQRIVFNSHMASVAKQFSGYHVQITARSADELTPKIIMEKINAAAGSKYIGATTKAQATKPKYLQAKEGANEDDWGDAKPVEEREIPGISKSNYSSDARNELQRFRSKHHNSSSSSATYETIETKSESKFNPDDDTDDNSSSQGISGLDSSTSYKPVGKIDLKAIRAEAKNSKFADARIEKIDSSYKPVGKVDLKAIREQARKEKQLKAEKAAQDESYLSGDEQKKKVGPQKQSEVKTPCRENFNRVTDADSEASEPESYDKVDRRVEYGQISEKSKSSQRKVSQGDNDDQPHFSSLADRMKAFQESVSGAKPKFDLETPAKSIRTPSSKFSSTKKSSPASVSSFAVGQSNSSDEDAPVSVAAQLARAKLSESKTNSDSSGSNFSNASSSQAAVSSFASRFAKKTDEKAYDDHDEDKLENKPVANSTQTRDQVVENDDKTEEVKNNESESSHTYEKSPLSAIVIEEYTKDDDDEMSLTLEEKIINIEQVDENWWIGENTKGETGLFPAAYVRLNDSVGTTDDTNSRYATTRKSESNVATTLYSHEPGPDDEDELAFEENEKITEIEFVSDDWWSGRNSKGDVGLFPSNYVRLE